MKKSIRILLAAATCAAVAIGCFACADKSGGNNNGGNGGNGGNNGGGDEPPVVTETVDLDKAYNALTLDVTEATESFALPYECEGAAVRWSSDGAAITTVRNMDDTIDAVVKQPAGVDSKVTLTATLSADGQAKQKTFEVTVLGYEATPGAGKFAAQSSNTNVVTDGDEKYVESLAGGYRAVWFDDEGSGDFYCETEATAFASYNLDVENYFGIAVGSRYGKAFFYLDAGNGLTASQCGYAAFDNFEWDYSARKKHVDVNYRGGNGVKLAVARSGNDIVFFIDGTAQMYVDGADIFGDGAQELDVGFMTKDTHVAFYDYDYVCTGGKAKIDAVDVDSIQVWTDSMKQQLVAGYRLSFASVEDGGSENADDIHVRFERTATALKLDMIGFGSFADNELVNAIIHTSTTDGGSWGLQRSDVYLKITPRGVYIRSDLGNYWDWHDPTSGTSTRLDCTVTQHAYYFTVTAEIPYAQLGLDADTSFKVMFVEGYLLGGTQNLYNSAVISNMRLNGIGTGDPAFQTSYVTVAADGKISR